MTWNILYNQCYCYACGSFISKNLELNKINDICSCWFVVTSISIYFLWSSPRIYVSFHSSNRYLMLFLQWNVLIMLFSFRVACVTHNTCMNNLFSCSCLRIWENRLRRVQFWDGIEYTNKKITISSISVSFCTFYSFICSCKQNKVRTTCLRLINYFGAENDIGLPSISVIVGTWQYFLVIL